VNEKERVLAGAQFTGIAAASGTGAREATEFAVSYCPACSAKLEARSCKMICSSCGYYMSCSDFY